MYIHSVVSHLLHEQAKTEERGGGTWGTAGEKGRQLKVT